MGTQLPSKKGYIPQFSAHVCYGQTAGWIKMPLGTEVGLRPGDSVTWGPSSPPNRGTAAPPTFRPIYCGQTADGSIKIPLGTKVGLDPCHIMLDGHPAPKGHAPNFRPCLLWPNGWMDQDGTWYGGRPLPRPHCVR